MEQQTPDQNPPKLQGKKRTALQTLSPISKRRRPLEPHLNQNASNPNPASQTFKDLKYEAKLLRMINVPKKQCPICSEARGHNLAKHTEFLRKNFR